MSLSSRLLLSLAAATILVAPATAADYSPPIFVEKMPDYVPVEVGSGWYLRGDITYNASKPVYDFTLFNRSTSNLRFGGGIGVGYSFSDLLRADATLNFVGRDKYSISFGDNSAKASHSAWSAMVNSYLDLGTVKGLTPYIGGGVGILHTRHDIRIGAPDFGVDFGWSHRQNRFAYALAAGLAYNISENTKIDVGYQFLNSPRTQYLDTDTLAIDRGVKHHQIRAGLRYELW